MKVLMRGKRIGVESLKKTNKTQGVFHMPEDSNAVGLIRYVGDQLTNSDLKVGMKVYYGDKRQPVTIGGLKIEVMDEDNIVAIVEDDADEQKTAQA